MSIAANLTYPIYVIANQDGALVLHSHGEDCVLLFHSRELAQWHIMHNPRFAMRPALHALAVPDVRALRDGLQQLPAEVTCAMWDADTGASPIHTGVEELLHALQG